ncbi:MAG TPA: hypothetical protein VMW10_06420 [Alphaproteobacteria bacterium]|nr:hypothetical protein [Alphaproteobacteria bacterium]
MVGKLFLILVAAAQLTATSAFAMNEENTPKGVTQSRPQPRKLSAYEAALQRDQEEKLEAALVKGQHVRADNIRNGKW